MPTAVTSPVPSYPLCYSYCLPDLDILLGTGYFTAQYTGQTMNRCLRCKFSNLLLCSNSDVPTLYWTAHANLRYTNTKTLHTCGGPIFIITPHFRINRSGPVLCLIAGIYVATSEHAFGFHDGHLLCRNLLLLSFGAVLAFLLEMSEFLVVSYASSLTLSVAGIFKVLYALSVYTW